MHLYKYSFVATCVCWEIILWQSFCGVPRNVKVDKTFSQELGALSKLQISQ